MTRKHSPSRQKSASTTKPAVEHGREPAAPHAAAGIAVAVLDAAGPPDLVARPEHRVAIEIDPNVTGAYVHDRFDLLIRGRAISAAAIEQVRLQAGDRVISAAMFGLPERAPAALMPDGRPGRQRGFQFNLPRPGDGQIEKFAFQIVARTEDGNEVAEDFEIEVDPAAAEPVVVCAGPARPTPGSARPYTVMYIERATIDAAGILTVGGWTVSLGPILSVTVLAGETCISKAKTGGVRQDVAAAFPTYPNARLSGFSLRFPLDEADRDAALIRVRAACLNGFGHEESIPAERLPPEAIVGPQAAAGHAVFAPAGPQPAMFSLFNPLPAYQLNADFRLADDPLFEVGVSFASPAAVMASPSGHRMVDMAGGAGRSASPLADRASAEIRMHCDAAELTGDGRLSVHGWAVSAAGVVQIRVLLDNEDAGLASTGHERPDVGAIFPQIPMSHLSGFRFEKQLGGRFAGEHVVRVVVRCMHGDEAEVQLSAVATEAVPREEEPPAEIVPDAEGADLTAEQAGEFRFELDSPKIAGGSAVEPVTGRLTVDGWLLTRTGIASFEIFLDDQRLGEAHYGLARQDVGAAFPEWPNALRSGYAFHCPPRSLRDGEHSVELRIRANSGVALSRRFRIAVKKADDQQESVGIRRRVPPAEADMMTALLADMAYRPSFRLILRQDAPLEGDRLGVTINALRLQAYPDWTVLVVAADDMIAAATRSLLDRSYPELAGRCSIITQADGTAWLAPPAADTGDQRPVLFGLLSPGDEPSADALLEFAVAAGRNSGCDLLYGDEVRPSPVSGEVEAFFKPDFSPDLLLSTNYIGRPWFATAELLARAGASLAGLAECGEYELLLRATEQACGVHHIPKLLCQRAAMRLDEAALERGALERAMDRRGISGTVRATPVEGTWRVQRAVQAAGKVSIIIPTCASHGHIETCIKTLRARTTYRDFEIICVDNIPAREVAWKVWLQKNADRVIEIPEAFNWSVFNNRAAELADGEFLLFLNDDIEIIQDDWLEAMMEHARRPEVGITGARLLYQDGKVQHAGMFLSTNGIGRHAFRFAAGDDPCYFGLALTQRNVIAVTGACMLVRRETFQRLGRFEEAHEIVNNDLDFCLRVHRAGLLTVYTPYATLTHYELASRANLRDVFDLPHFNAAWKTIFAAGDPYFNPRLSRHADDYRPDDEPVQWVVPGAPMFRPDEIHRILVVKLDHIGDFVTALPPIRRLKKLFPHGEITVLAGPASRAFIPLEPAIDAFIPFAFFHARSQLGERALSKDDYAELAEKLRPHRFDLAVDLRKHPSTRDVLKHTGARFLAGFDYLGQFPYLDVALDWDGDRNLQRKRSHIVDDLMALVNAIGHATESDRRVMQPGPAAMPLSELPPLIRALFGKPVVAVHPGAGNVTKQWPEEHFAALIDLLVEKNGVNILLVGGPDELEIANALLEDVKHSQAIASMVGNTSLADLPRLLKNCVLYIGNDSGPKHIAAAIGIPTVGIHSGVVDPVEWGPLGRNAVALRRNMTCSPCYLANAEDCPRSLACLRVLEPNLVYETANMLLPAPRPLLPPGPAAAGEPASPPAAGHTGAAEAQSARKPKAGRGLRATEPA